MCERDAKSAYTHKTHSLVTNLGFIKFCNLRGEGRMGWEGRVKNGVRMKHKITLESIKFSFC